MMICPYDCNPCSDPSCRYDGCQQVSEVAHMICDGCGEPVGCVNCVHLCVACVRVSDKSLSLLNKNKKV